MTPTMPKKPITYSRWLLCKLNRRHDFEPQRGRKFYVRQYFEGGSVDLTLYILTCTRCGMERHDTCTRQHNVLVTRWYDRSSAPDGYYGEAGEAEPHEDLARQFYAAVPEPVDKNVKEIHGKAGRASVASRAA